jgi:hypothetical protein
MFPSTLAVSFWQILDIRLQISDTILVSKSLLGNLFSISSTVFGSVVQRTGVHTWVDFRTLNMPVLNSTVAPLPLVPP